MRMGPVLLRMMRGCPEKRQNKLPAIAVPRKLSITPCHVREQEAQGGRRDCCAAVSSEIETLYLGGKHIRTQHLYVRRGG